MVSNSIGVILLMLLMGVDSISFKGDDVSESLTGEY